MRYIEAVDWLRAVLIQVRIDLSNHSLTIQQFKVTLLVDTKVNAILDLHVTTTRKYDSQNAPSIIKRLSETHVGTVVGLAFVGPQI